MKKNKELKKIHKQLKKIAKALENNGSNSETLATIYAATYYSIVEVTQRIFDKKYWLKDNSIDEKVLNEMFKNVTINSNPKRYKR